MVKLSKIGLLTLAFTVLAIALCLTAKADNNNNDDFDNAELITPGIHYGNVSGGDIYDYYKISINGGDIIYTNLTRNGKTTLNLSIYDEDRNFVKGGEIGYDSTASIRLSWTTNFSKESYTYYIVIQYKYWQKSEHTLQVGIGKQNDAKSGKDAGDIITNALQISPGKYENNTLGDYDINDFYKIVLNSGETLKISVKMANTNYDLMLYDENGNIKAVSNNSGTTEEVINWASNSTYPSHEYYVLVSGNSSGKYSIEFVSGVQKDANIDGDAGNLFGNARIINVGSYLGIIGGDDDGDIYKIGIGKGEKIRAKISNATLFIYSSTEIERANTTNTIEFITNSSNPFYYLVIKSTAYKMYSFEVSKIGSQNDGNSSEDADDSFVNAILINENTWYKDNMLGNDDTNDLYKIILNGGDEINAEIYTSFDYKLAIYGEDGILRAKSNKTISWLTNSSKQNYTYYIGVEGTSSGDYDLKFGFEKQNDIGSNKDAGNNFEDAMSIMEKSYLNNKIGNDDTDDYYKITILSERTIVVMASNVEVSIYSADYTQKGYKFWDKNKYKWIWHSDISQDVYVRISAVSPTTYSIGISFSDSKPSAVVGFEGNKSKNDKWTKYTEQKFTWQRASSEFGIKGFYYTKDGTTPTLNSEFTSEQSFVWNNIPEGKHTIKIVSVDYADSLSDVFTFILKVDTKPPTPLEDIRVKGTTESTITISWKKNDDVDFEKYEIEYWIIETDKQKVEPIYDRNKTEINIGNLIPDTTYIIEISVVDGTGQRKEIRIEEKTKPRTEIPLYLILAIVVIAIAILSAVFFVMRKKKTPKKKEYRIEKKKMEVKKDEKKEDKKKEELDGEELWRQLRKERR